MTPADASVLRAASAHVLVDDVGTVTVDEPAAHHLFRVLRLRPGEAVTVTDGRGAWRECRVADGEVLVADGEIRTEPPRHDPLTVAFAIPKRDRPDWVVQKLTELGVGRIVLLHADRSVVRWDGSRADRHLDKLRRVAAEALQQSRGVWLPTVDGPVDGTDVLAEAVAAEPGGRALGPGDRFVAVGPEGGWSERELQLARDRVDLGPTVLRVETAALVVASRAGSHSP